MADLTEKLAELEDQQGQIIKKLDELGDPVYKNRKGQTAGGFEADDSEPERELIYDPNGETNLDPIRKSRKRRRYPEGYEPRKVWKSFGEFVREGFESGGSQKFRDRVREAHQWDELKKRHDGNERITKAIQGMSESVGTDGGFTVMPEFSTDIHDRVFANDLLERTDGFTVSGNSLTLLANSETSRADGSRHGGLRGYWVDEGESITKSNPGFRRLTLNLKKVAVVVYLTEELISDAGVALEQYIVRKTSEEFNFLLGDAIINGQGTSDLLGILNSLPLVSVAKESGQEATTLVYENVNKMWARAFAPSRTNAVWLHNQDIEPELHEMVLGIGTAGVPVYLPPGAASAAPYGSLKGRPLLPTEFNATLGTQGDLILADPSQYVTITKGGINQAASMHVQFLTDQTALRFTMRVDGTTWDNAPLTPYKGTSNTQSPFVALDTRS